MGELRGNNNLLLDFHRWTDAWWEKMAARTANRGDTGSGGGWLETWNGKRQWFFSLVAEVQSAFIHTLFSAGAGLSLSEEEPMMEGGGASVRVGWGGGETTDAGLIVVWFSWGWSVCSLAPPPGAPCGKPWLYLQVERRWYQVREPKHLIYF